MESFIQGHKYVVNSTFQFMTWNALKQNCTIKKLLGLYHHRNMHDRVKMSTRKVLEWLNSVISDRPNAEIEMALAELEKGSFSVMAYRMGMLYQVHTGSLLCPRLGIKTRCLMWPSIQWNMIIASCWNQIKSLLFILREFIGTELFKVCWWDVLKNYFRFKSVISVTKLPPLLTPSTKHHFYIHAIATAMMWTMTTAMTTTMTMTITITITTMTTTTTTTTNNVTIFQECHLLWNLPTSV